MGALLTLMVGAKLGYTYWSMQDVDDPDILEKNFLRRVGDGGGWRVDECLRLADVRRLGQAAA